MAHVKQYKKISYCWFLKRYFLYSMLHPHSKNPFEKEALSAQEQNNKQGSSLKGDLPDPVITGISYIKVAGFVNNYSISFEKFSNRSNTICKIEITCPRYSDHKSIFCNF